MFQHRNSSTRVPGSQQPTIPICLTHRISTAAWRNNRIFNFKENTMTTQLELMRILNATNNFYNTPGTRTWDPAGLSDAVFFHDTTKNTDFIFDLNPETFTIKMWAVKNHHKITVFTPTITLGSSRFAPDIVIALHTLFSFDFASDATFVVQNGLIRKLPMTSPQTRSQRPSDAIVANPPTSSVSSSTSPPQSFSQSSPSSSTLRHRIFRKLLFLK